MKKKHIELDKTFWLWFIPLAFLIRPIHEFGHWICYKLYGIEVYYTLNQVVPKDMFSYKLLGEAGGPLLNILLVLVGVGLIYFSKQKKLGLALIITNAYARLIPYILLGIYNVWDTNDEGVVAQVLNLPLGTFYIIFGIFFILAIAFALYHIKMNTKWITLQLVATFLIAYITLIHIMQIPQDMFFDNYHVNWPQAILHMQNE